jgi:hypothetical protein
MSKVSIFSQTKLVATVEAVVPGVVDFPGVNTDTTFTHFEVDGNRFQLDAPVRILPSYFLSPVYPRLHLV